MSSPSRPPGQQRDFDGRAARYRRDSSGSSAHDAAAARTMQPEYYDFSESEAPSHQGNGRRPVNGQPPVQNGERGNAPVASANVSRGAAGGASGGQAGAPSSPRSRPPSYRGPRPEDVPPPTAPTAPTSNMKVPAESQLARISRQARRQAYAAAAAEADSQLAAGPPSRDPQSNVGGGRGGGGGGTSGGAAVAPLFRRAILQDQRQPQQSQQSEVLVSSPPESIGAQIQRLNSPSVAANVLQPLDAKVVEYSGVMASEQAIMARLDEELRILESRRREAEARFLEAKTKHDEYQQQYEDVQRVLRGELSRLQLEQQQQQMAAQQRAAQEQEEQQQHHLNSPDQLRHQRADSFGSVDMRSESRHSGAKLKRNRWRMTLFGNSSP